MRVYCFYWFIKFVEEAGKHIVAEGQPSIFSYVIFYKNILLEVLGHQVNFSLKYWQAKPGRHIWIGGISSSVTAEQLEDEFSQFGKIDDYKFYRDRNSALVGYFKLDDAIAAQKNINGKSIGGEQVRADFQKPQTQKPQSSRRVCILYHCFFIIINTAAAVTLL